MAHTSLAHRLQAAALTLCSLCGASALAASGLVVTQPEDLWPQWQARIAVQTASLSPVSLAGQLSSVNASGGSAARGLQGGALFGDYYFARPSFGAFRASGGLLIGSLAGAPLLLNTPAGGRLSLAVNTLGNNLPAATLDNPGTLPYLGVGFTGAASHSLAITADLGLVAERPSGTGSLGRAMFGTQGMDNALRDMRLSPVLQLGVRYTF